MANAEHVAMLNEGVARWNRWREQYPEIRPDLLELELPVGNFAGVDLRGADLRGADLGESDLRHAILDKADLYAARAWRANLTGASLVQADLSNSNFNRAILRGANLNHAVLRFARFILADVSEANLSGCFVYGCSFWNLRGTPKEQLNVVITPKSEPVITVDNVEFAQFMYLLLSNHRIREMIDTITAKTVLILGRFTPERKVVLDTLRDELRKRNYLPVLFDFEKPASRDLTETVSTLAHMARFVIADITDAKSIPQELAQIAPHLPSVPIQPLLLSSQQEYGMFEHFRRYPWVLPAFLYDNQENLLNKLEEKVIAPAEVKARAG